MTEYTNEDPSMKKQENTVVRENCATLSHKTLRGLKTACFLLILITFIDGNQSVTPFRATTSKSFCGQVKSKNDKKKYTPKVSETPHFWSNFSLHLSAKTFRRYRTELVCGLISVNKSY